jgi:hypothetical protein
VRSVFSIVVLAMLSGSALADWTAVGLADEIYAAYADTGSIRRSGGSVTMYGLYDFRRQDFTPEGHGLYSTVVLREYDCEARRVRLLSSIDFSGHMGEGAPASSSHAPRRWEPIHPGGIDEAYWGVACGGK